MNMLSHFKLSRCLVVIFINLLSILCCLQILLNFNHLIFHISNSLEYFIFYYTKIQMGSSSMNIDTHYYRKINQMQVVFPLKWFIHQYILNMFSTTWLTLFVYPFDCGWYVVLKFISVPNPLNNPF